MTRIGGALDYAKLAQQNKPSDPAVMAAEIKRLYAEGLLRPRDIASSLGVHIDIVMRAINLDGEQQ